MGVSVTAPVKYFVACCKSTQHKSTQHEASYSRQESNELLPRRSTTLHKAKLTTVQLNHAIVSRKCLFTSYTKLQRIILGKMLSLHVKRNCITRCLIRMSRFTV